MCHIEATPDERADERLLRGIYERRRLIQASAPPSGRFAQAGFPAVRAGDQVDDRQAEPGAAAPARLVGAAEAVERPRQEVLGAPRGPHPSRAARPGRRLRTAEERPSRRRTTSAFSTRLSSACSSRAESPLDRQTAASARREAAGRPPGASARTCRRPCCEQRIRVDGLRCAAAGAPGRSGRRAGDPRRAVRAGRRRPRPSAAPARAPPSNAGAGGRARARRGEARAASAARGSRRRRSGARARPLPRAGRASRSASRRAARARRGSGAAGSRAPGRRGADRGRPPAHRLHGPERGRRRAGSRRGSRSRSASAPPEQELADEAVEGLVSRSKRRRQHDRPPALRSRARGRRGSATRRRARGSRPLRSRDCPARTSRSVASGDERRQERRRDVERDPPVGSDELADRGPPGASRSRTPWPCSETWLAASTACARRPWSTEDSRVLPTRR